MLARGFGVDGRDVVEGGNVEPLNESLEPSGHDDDRHGKARGEDRRRANRVNQHDSVEAQRRGVQNLNERHEKGADENVQNSAEEVFVLVHLPSLRGYRGVGNCS